MAFSAPVLWTIDVSTYTKRYAANRDASNRHGGLYRLRGLFDFVDHSGRGLGPRCGSLPAANRELRRLEKNSLLSLRCATSCFGHPHSGVVMTVEAAQRDALALEKFGRLFARRVGVGQCL